jgi:hypothetical protein
MSHGYVTVIHAHNLSFTDEREVATEVILHLGYLGLFHKANIASYLPGPFNHTWSRTLMQKRLARAVGARSHRSRVVWRSLVSYKGLRAIHLTPVPPQM